MTCRQRVIIGITGASGAALGLRTLELVADSFRVETHLVISPAAERTLALEVGTEAADKARSLASVVYDAADIGARIASGSFRSDGMIIAPCSMRTLSAIAHGLTDNLLTRAADVTLKERRRLVLLAREAPLHAGHLEAMLRLTRLGAIVMPPVPAFYARPSTVDEIITQIAARGLELLGVDVEDAIVRWQGAGESRDSDPREICAGQRDAPGKQQGGGS